MGRMCFYRPGATAGGLQPQIQVNDFAVGKGTSKSFLLVDREPGDYTIKTSDLQDMKYTGVPSSLTN